MSSAQIPTAFQAITHLGAPVRVFSPWRNAVTYLAIPVLFLALGGLFWRIERSDGTPLPSRLWGGLGFWLLLTAGLAFWHLRRLTWGVIYEDGFAYSRGGQVSAFRWEDVVSVTIFPVRRRYCHRVEAATGDQFTFTGNPDYMGQMVRDQSFRARRQRIPASSRACCTGSWKAPGVPPACRWRRHCCCSSTRWSLSCRLWSR